MDDLTVFIPSRSRFSRSLTLDHLAADGIHAVLVVPYEQKSSYASLARGRATVEAPKGVNGISLVRQWCGANSPTEKFIMLDDDLRFYVRRDRTGEDTRLRKLEPGEMREMLTLVSTKLDTYAHVAISARQANNGLDFPGRFIGRPLRALAYRRSAFLKCEHGRVAIMEDFDVTLQLLSMGYANWIISLFAQDQGQTQMPGGCSDYRTKEVQAQNVRKMARLWPHCVEVIEKENKTGGDFGKRIDARISWRGAYPMKELPFI